MYGVGDSVIVANGSFGVIEGIEPDGLYAVSTDDGDILFVSEAELQPVED